MRQVPWPACSAKLFDVKKLKYVNLTNFGSESCKDSYLQIRDICRMAICIPADISITFLPSFSYGILPRASEGLLRCGVVAQLSAKCSVFHNPY